MTLLICLVCIIYASVIIANPLQTTAYFSTSTSVTSTDTLESPTNTSEPSSSIINGYEVIEYNETRVTTRPMNFHNTSRTYNLEDGNFMIAVGLENGPLNNSKISLYFTASVQTQFNQELVFIETEFCTVNHFPPSVIDQISNQNIIGSYL